MGKRELFALLNFSYWCLVMIKRLFLAVQWGCLRFAIVGCSLFLVRVRAKIQKNTLLDKAFLRMRAKIETNILFGRLWLE